MPRAPDARPIPQEGGDAAPQPDSRNGPERLADEKSSEFDARTERTEPCVGSAAVYWKISARGLRTLSKFFFPVPIITFPPAAESDQVSNLTQARVPAAAWCTVAACRVCKH
ncbi:hypothetical protein PGTUg99_024189 [Puccinia graminis f. sp. tritici]|uniref:Uncharacterized protein n=1 Tax=Puccinia graminis f. sp. tritici TaxID=56615 RepID=A0A5B0SJM8_PUCGR|nr:hypothetical protein PGTUg99_024189 [Puccinia graminis f. sp. tritici]